MDRPTRSLATMLLCVALAGAGCGSNAPPAVDERGSSPPAIDRTELRDDEPRVLYVRWLETGKGTPHHWTVALVAEIHPTRNRYRFIAKDSRLSQTAISGAEASLLALIDPVPWLRLSDKPGFRGCLTRFTAGEHPDVYGPYGLKCGDDYLERLSVMGGGQRRDTRFIPSPDPRKAGDLPIPPQSWNSLLENFNAMLMSPAARAAEGGGPSPFHDYDVTNVDTFDGGRDPIPAEVKYCEQLPEAIKMMGSDYLKFAGSCIEARFTWAQRQGDHVYLNYWTGITDHAGEFLVYSSSQKRIIGMFNWAGPPGP
jgi:hypothetical protein